MPSRIFGSLSMQSTSMSASWLTSTRCGSRAFASSGSAGASGTVTEKCEPRPGLRLQRDAVIEHARDALHDREAEPEAARDLRALIEPVEFAENLPLLRLRNAEAGIVDVDAQPAVCRPAADQHAALRRVLDRVRDEVLQQPAQQPPVGAHRARARHEGQREALLARERRELDFELAHHLVHAES